MVLIRFYGVLATTASIFVGILTAYLVTRLSDLKSERSRIAQRIDSIDAELQVLDRHRERRIENLQQTQTQWQIEDAQDEVDNFIQYNVGDEWNPSPNSATPEDAMDALSHYRDVPEDDLLVAHFEEIEDRWDDIIDKIQPSDPFGVNIPDAALSSETYDSANWIIEAIWNVYEREKYDYNESRATEIYREIEQLEDERKVLVEQYNSADPQQLRDSIKSTIMPIILSVVLPLLVRFLHELGWVLSVSSPVAVVEPVIVLAAWLVGFFWTLRFVWVRVTDTDNELPESPLTDDEHEPEQPSEEPDDTEETGNSEEAEIT